MTKSIKLNGRSSLKDFHDFFAAIPSDKWCVDYFTDDQGRRCARGHVGGNNSATSAADIRLRKVAPIVAFVNNGGGCGITSNMEAPLMKIIKKRGIKNRVLSYLKYLMGKKRRAK